MLLFSISITRSYSICWLASWIKSSAWNNFYASSQKMQALRNFCICPHKKSPLHDAPGFFWVVQKAPTSQRFRDLKATTNYFE